MSLIIRARNERFQVCQRFDTFPYSFKALCSFSTHKQALFYIKTLQDNTFNNTTNELYY